jgi:hypothetical protein
MMLFDLARAIRARDALAFVTAVFYLESVSVVKTLAQDTGRSAYGRLSVKQ